MRRLLTAAEVAEMLAVRPGTVYLWAKQRRIPHVVLSRGGRKTCLRFRPDAITQWLKRCEVVLTLKGKT